LAARAAMRLRSDLLGIQGPFEARSVDGRLDRREWPLGRAVRRCVATGRPSAFKARWPLRKRHGFARIVGNLRKNYGYPMDRVI
jgi:hypothetical protein